MKAVTIIQSQTSSCPSKILVPRFSQSPLLPRHWQPLICSLSLQTCLCGTFHLNRITQYVVSCVWLPSPSIKVLRFIHGAARIDVSFLFIEWPGLFFIGVRGWSRVGWTVVLLLGQSVESLEPFGLSQLVWRGLLASHNAQDSPTAQYYVAQMSMVLKLRIPGLDFTEFLLIFKVLV